MTEILGNFKEEVVLIMEGALTIERAGEVKEMILNAMRNSATVVMRFMENSRIDISFLQLVCAAHRSALSSGKHLKLVQDIPDSLLKEIRSAGYAHNPFWDL
jgi:anti-anti-sigma regulatory factor